MQQKLDLKHLTNTKCQNLCFLRGANRLCELVRMFLLQRRGRRGPFGGAQFAHRLRRIARLARIPLPAGR